MSTTEPKRRTIKSFVRRTGRITPSQEKALDELWPVYGIDYAPEPLALDDVFGRHAERVLEIGFGNGETLVELARAHPERDYLGVDVYEPGIGRLLAAASQLGLANLRVLRGDAAEVLGASFPAQSLAEILVLFPDPWPKKRHHKRRLVQAAFVERVADCLAPGGILHLATDWEGYAEHMLSVLEAEPLLENVAGAGNYYSGVEVRPVTKFERRGARLGNVIRDLRFRRRPACT